MPENGLYILNSTDPGFASSASKVSDTSFEQIKPFCFVLKNVAANKLVSYTLQWTYVTAKGSASNQFSRFAQVNEFLDGNVPHGPSPPSTYSISPGQERLVCPLFNVPAQMPRLPPLASAVKTFLRVQGDDQSVTLTLDAALFETGDFWGTDTKGLFRRVQCMIQARQQLFSAVTTSTSSADLASLLSVAAAGANLNSPPPDSAADAALLSFFQADAAQPLIAMNAAKGADAVRATARQLLYVQTPTLVRR